MIAAETWIGSAAVAAVTALLTYLTARNRNTVDAGQSIVEAASKVVEALQSTHAMDRDTISQLVAERDQLRGDVARLTETVEALRADVGALTRHVARLEEILQRHGIEPPPRGAPAMHVEERDGRTTVAFAVDTADARGGGG